MPFQHTMGNVGFAPDSTFTHEPTFADATDDPWMNGRGFEEQAAWPTQPREYAQDPPEFLHATSDVPYVSPPSEFVENLPLENSPNPVLPRERHRKIAITTAGGEPIAPSKVSTGRDDRERAGSKVRLDITDRAGNKIEPKRSPSDVPNHVPLTAAASSESFAESSASRIVDPQTGQVVRSGSSAPTLRAGSHKVNIRDAQGKEIQVDPRLTPQQIAEQKLRRELDEQIKAIQRAKPCSAKPTPPSEVQKPKSDFDDTTFSFDSMDESPSVPSGPTPGRRMLFER